MNHKSHPVVGNVFNGSHNILHNVVGQGRQAVQVVSHSTTRRAQGPVAGKSELRTHQEQGNGATREYFKASIHAVNYGLAYKPITHSRYNRQRICDCLLEEAR